MRGKNLQHLSAPLLEVAVTACLHFIRGCRLGLCGFFQFWGIPGRRGTEHRVRISLTSGDSLEYMRKGGKMSSCGGSEKILPKPLGS